MRSRNNKPPFGLSQNYRFALAVWLQAVIALDACVLISAAYTHDIALGALGAIVAAGGIGLLVARTFETDPAAGEAS